jgi:hypothetical protein
MIALEGDLDDGAPVPLLFLHPCVLPVELLETWAAGEVPEGRAGVLAELEPPAYLGDGGRTSPCGSWAARGNGAPRNLSSVRI